MLRQNITSTLWSFLKDTKLLIGLSVASTLLAGVLEGATVVIIGAALEVIISDNLAPGAVPFVSSLPFSTAITELPRETLFLALIGFAIITQILRSGSQFGSELAVANLSARIEGHILNAVFQQFMLMSFTQVASYKLGEITDWTRDSLNTGNFLRASNQFLTQAILVAIYAVGLFWLSPQLTLIIIVALGGLSLGLRSVMRRVQGNAKHYITASVTFTERITEFLSGIKLIRSFSQESYAIQQVEESVDKATTARRNSFAWKAIINPTIEALTVMSAGVVFVVGYFIFGIENPEMMARFATFIFILFRMSPRIAMLNGNIGSLNQTFPSVERIANILRTDDKDYEINRGRYYDGFKDEIRFDNISLQYTDLEHSAVCDLSFVISWGDIVAFVGESGAGKSTLVNLLLRLYEPTSGRILVDGVDLSELDVKAWRKKIGIVSQETFLLNTSIRENLLFARPDATEDDLIAAAKAAYAHQFISDLANGYDTVVGDRGYRLSGGQRQRIALARALLRDPEILILDEATSELDSQSEQMIQQAIMDIRGARTIVIVAHRLSTVAMADRIIVLKGGRIVEQGAHDKLIAMQQDYARLWELQTGRITLNESK